MLDQLVAYKGEVFFGTWFSTLSGYVNRLVSFSSFYLNWIFSQTFNLYYFVFLTLSFALFSRMRGYYSAKHKQEGYEEGILNSYYFVPKEKKQQMRKYRAVKLPIYMREFPTSWRDIDKGIGEL
jgi:hypothetical protein